jgi:PAS domain-containing protein
LSIHDFLIAKAPARLQRDHATWNHSAAELFGYTADEIIGKPVTLLIPADRKDEEPGILERVARVRTSRRVRLAAMCDVSDYTPGNVGLHPVQSNYSDRMPKLKVRHALHQARSTPTSAPRHLSGRPGCTR